MKVSTKILLICIVDAILALEFACRTGLVPLYTAVPPSVMVAILYQRFADGSIYPDIQSTFLSIVIAAVSAIVTGFVAGAAIYGAKRLRNALDPFLTSYYAVPVWVFYPLFIFIFGLTDTPKIVIAYLYAVVAMIVNTLNGFDRVPRVMRKTAAVFGMGRVEMSLRIIIPSVVPYVFTGVKLAISYAFLGTIGAEFLLSTAGLGYQISWAYTSFDGGLLYSTILLIVLISITINTSLNYWERKLMRRRGMA